MSRFDSCHADDESSELARRQVDVIKILYAHGLEVEGGHDRASWAMPDKMPSMPSARAWARAAWFYRVRHGEVQDSVWDRWHCPLQHLDLIHQEAWAWKRPIRWIKMPYGMWHVMPFDVEGPAHEYETLLQ